MQSRRGGGETRGLFLAKTRKREKIRMHYFTRRRKDAKGIQVIMLAKFKNVLEHSLFVIFEVWDSFGFIVLIFYCL